MERKPVTLCYWVTDLVGIRVATDIKCHPRIAPIGQRGPRIEAWVSGSLGPFWDEAHGPAGAPRQIWVESEQEAEERGFQILHKHPSQSVGVGDGGCCRIFPGPLSQDVYTASACCLSTPHTSRPFEGLVLHWDQRNGERPHSFAVHDCWNDEGGEADESMRFRNGAGVLGIVLSMLHIPTHSILTITPWE